MLLDPLIGHRGCASLAPENTLVGIRKAAESGIGAVEIDVVLTADKQLVIHHDRTINRCTNGQGELLSFSLEQLRQLDNGSWFSKYYTGEKIPTLQEALTLIQELNLKLNLEIKMHQHTPAALVKPVLDQLAVYWPDSDNIVLSSFDHQVLRLCHQQAPHYRVGHLFESLPENWQQQAGAVNARSIHVSHKQLTAKQAETIKAEGFELYVYTVNCTDEAQKLYRMGVDGLFSDQPHLLTGLSIYT